MEEEGKAITWCVGRNINEIVEAQNQVFEYEAPVQRKTIRNFFCASYICYATPGSKPWKRFRLLRLAVWIVLIPVLLGTGLAFLLLDPAAYAQTGAEWAGLAIGILGIFVLLLFCNPDTVYMSVTTLVALLDFLCVLIVSTLLLVYGQGFVYVGTTFLLDMFAYSYTAPSFDVAGRLNSRSNSAWARNSRTAGLMGMICAACLFRAMIFLKQFTVTNGIVLLVIVGEEPVTLRDLWEFFVDIIVVRMFYIALEQVRRPIDILPLGPAHGHLTRSP